MGDDFPRGLEELSDVRFGGGVTDKADAGGSGGGVAQSGQDGDKM